MRDSLATLIGKKVTRLQRVHDYIELSIGTEMIDIFNPMQVDGPATAKGISGLEGLELEDVEEGDDLLVMRFEDGSAIRVDLRDDAYVGPEAVVYHRQDGSAVVW